MPTVIIEIPYGKYLEAGELKKDGEFMKKLLLDVRKECLRETKREFSDYARRAGADHKPFLKTLYSMDLKQVIYILSTEEIPSTGTDKQIMLITKAGNYYRKNLPLTLEKKWISDGILKNSFIQRLEDKYQSKVLESVLDELYKKTIGSAL